MALWKKKRRSKSEKTSPQYRDALVAFRIAWSEYNALANLAKETDTSMSWLIREALVQKYPKLFIKVNRGRAINRSHFKAGTGQFAPVANTSSRFSNDDLTISD